MASKTESTFLNMVLALFLVALVASATLGYVYELTKEPIAKAKLEKKMSAIKKVVPAFDNIPSEKSQMYLLASEGNGDSLECYPARMGDKLVGTAIKTYSDLGFTKRIYIMVGFLPNGIIQNISVLEHAETPGLGDKMEKKKSPWSERFNGKNPANYKLKVTKDQGDVEAITAATISSRAYTDAVDRAYKAYMKSGTKK